MSGRCIAVVLLALFTVPSSAAKGPNRIEGRWENPKHTTQVDVRVCGEGPDYCAVVLKASPNTQENARKGGTLQFIGTEILRVHDTGDGTFRGTAFDPETNMHVGATVQMAGPGVMEVKGCAMMGLVCEAQAWTKVNEAALSSSRARKRRKTVVRR